MTCENSSSSEAQSASTAVVRSAMLRREKNDIGSMRSFSAKASLVRADSP